MLGLSFIFNITKFISISPIGPDLQKIPEYLKFILFFQAFHPLTTTGLAPLCILLFLNYKVKNHNSSIIDRNLLNQMSWPEIWIPEIHLLWMLKSVLICLVKLDLFFGFLAMAFCPFGNYFSLNLTITSLQIYAQMKEAKRFYRPGSKRTKEFMLARTMMVLVLVFLILNTPRLILGLIEVNKNSY